MTLQKRKIARFQSDETYVPQIQLRREGAGDILDVGANIGLFSIFCHRVLAGDFPLTNHA